MSKILSEFCLCHRLVAAFRKGVPGWFELGLTSIGFQFGNTEKLSFRNLRAYINSRTHTATELGDTI